MTTKWSIRHVVYVIALAAATGAFAYWFEPLVRIWKLHAGSLVFTVLCMLGSIVVQAVNFTAFLGNVPVRPGLWTLSRVWALSSLANYLGPLQPGIAVRVAYLARLGIGWRTSLLATWRQLCVSVWVSLGGSALGLAAGFSGDHRLLVLAAVLGTAFIAAPFARGLILAALARASRPAWLVSRREVLSEALRGMPSRGVAGVLAQYAIGAVLLWVVYGAFGASITWGHALVLACMVYVSSLVALLPGNLGLLDAIYVLGGHGLGLSVPEAAALAVLLRAGQIVACAILALAGPIRSRAQA